MDLFSRIAEDKIKEAIKKGELENLPGLGQPLDLKDDLPGMPNDLKMAYRILKNAGYTPEDIKKEIMGLEDLISYTTDDEEKSRLAKKLTKKQMELERLLEKRGTTSNSRFGSYAAKIYGKLKDR